MTSSLLEMLRASLGSRTILCVAATIILMVVAFILLELNYRQEAAQDSAEIVTGSLPNSPPARAPSGAFMAPPPTTGPTQTLTQSTVASRAPVPLPRSRPNRR
jgi:hypothetical protein